MSKMIMFFFLVYSGSVLSSPVEHKLLCEASDQDSGSQVILHLSFDGGRFSIENPERGCRSEYVYRESSNESGVSFIYSYPTIDDMGLNAQIMIFATSSKSGSADYIGSIPAGASESQDGSYKDIQQSGDSIYETIYRIEDREVLALAPSKELIIGGDQCVFKEKTGGVCQKMRGSFKKPVCVFNYGERRVLADAKECTEMSENL
ncbi:hypothetical protein [Pseudomonas monsensis]|uniref:hypothetical protein n=1 Tax=Pseudomonas monsensis TaxID=2745509 RepID=UPI003D22CD6D